MRKIDRIIVHCTATPEGRPHIPADVARWHLEKGYAEIGYHFLIGLKGETWIGRNLEKPGAHAQGFNLNSIGVCYVGGMTADMKQPKDTRTSEQKTSLLILLKNLKIRFPNAEIIGHCNVAKRDCPCFNAITEYKEL
jgi:N-acetylmuramoyl-L-alanine amidase